MKTLQGKTVLITGASAGIGESFAYEMAKQGATTLILTARSEEKLQRIANTISKEYKSEAFVFTGDLTQKETAGNLYKQIKQAGLIVDILVNNAGIGKWTNFLDQPIEVYEEILELNINSLVKLTQLVIPDMVKKGEGGILNIASTGALQPCPYVAVYCASKAFVLSFSEALYGEFYKKGITITAICPGNTDTGFQAIANANTKGMSFDTPQTVAKKGIEAFLKGNNNKIIGTVNYLQSLMPRLLPRKTVIHIVSGMMSEKINK